MKDLKTRLEELQSHINNYEFDNDYTFDDKLDPSTILREIDNEELGNADNIINFINSNFFGEYSEISKEDVKEVFLSLKDRVENPRGKFDKQGRFYVFDSDLTDCRTPSVKYPYSEMNQARTSKFIKKLAIKYRCETLEDLELVAYS